MNSFGIPFESLVDSFPKLATALRQAWKEGYRLTDLRADLVAGCIVGVVALPLSMALAIASGVPPQHGLYTAIVAGITIALLGGSRVQVSGPTAAFVVLLAPISAEFGLGGLTLATFMAGLILLTMGIARMGRLIEFVPYPVTTGFTAGIAVVIATLQLKDFLGLTLPVSPSHFPEKVWAIIHAIPSARWQDVSIGILSLAILIWWPRLDRRIPAPLVALVSATLLAIGLSMVLPDFEVATIRSRFSYVLDGQERPGIPQVAPVFQLPWFLPGPNGQPLVLTMDLIRSLLGPALSIAMLGAIESLLSAVVADGMAGTKHDPDAELVAQGVGNLVAPWFGGIAATGAIARTATNIRSGARSPLAAVFHGIFLLATVVLVAPILGYLPMASLSALMLLVAWNMSELKHFAYVMRVGPRSDTAVLLTCFLLTVLFDMVVSVSVGVVLAALLFMQRMASVSQIRLVHGPHPSITDPLPEGVVLYEIGGPLFFGAAQKAMSALQGIGAGVRTVVVDMRSVPVMDATGLVNLRSTLDRLNRAGVKVILGGVNSQPRRLLMKAAIPAKMSNVVVSASFHHALDLVRASA